MTPLSVPSTTKSKTLTPLVMNEVRYESEDALTPKETLMKRLQRLSFSDASPLVKNAELDEFNYDQVLDEATDDAHLREDILQTTITNPPVNHYTLDDLYYKLQILGNNEEDMMEKEVQMDSLQEALMYMKARVTKDELQNELLHSIILAHFSVSLEFMSHDTIERNIALLRSINDQEKCLDKGLLNTIIHDDEEVNHQNEIPLLESCKVKVQSEEVKSQSQSSHTCNEVLESINFAITHDTGMLV